MKTLALALAVLAVTTLACNDKDDAGGNGTGGGGSGAAGGTGTGTGTGSGTGTGVGGPGAAPKCTITPDDGDCVGQLYSGLGVPVDIYIMFDQSGSMATKDDGTTMRIDAVRKAVDQFLKSPDSKGINVGIGYFGYHPLMCACTSCNPMDYAKAAVNMGALPDHATPLMGSLNAIQPTGETPTGPAIRGACMYAQSWKKTRVGHQVVILLVTDGNPQAPITSMGGACNPTLEDATAAAAECQVPAVDIKTYVLGVGPDLAKLNKIAEAGGTKQAYLVEKGGETDILKALNAIRSDSAIPCSLQMPMTAPGVKVDASKVNVIFANASCAAMTMPRVKDAMACAPSGGWYYDDPTNPSKIELCKTSCDAVSSPGSQLLLSVGCRQQIVE